ncbi:MAG: type I polyketide synthase [Deltaproteobacteria bacterium]|nr:type I polyketide synthase [Deltaproteobacteria bacterium]
MTRLKNYSPIAVVSMAGVFPGASTLDQFWRNIVEKKDACGDIPESRWVARPADMVSSRPALDKAFHRRGCLIRDFDFDPDGFAIPADSLRSLDPMVHLVLHAGRQAFSSFQSASIEKNRIAVILAAIALPTEASSRLAQEILGESFKNALFRKSPHPLSPLTRNQCQASQVTALPAAILARALGLYGPAFTLDAACASSLYAVKLACDMLSAHRCDAVLAGGVSRPDCLYTQVGFSQLRALSPSGRCAPFDAWADGLVVGEGAGLLVLKRLEDALKDGDTISGIIRGIGLSNDMRGNLLAPDTEGQVRAMQAAYQAAGWGPSDVDIIECHGAGTPVGDATELQSLKLLWENTGAKSGRCAIGSIKSMIGHLLTAAGAAGMIKTLLALKHQILPPSLNFTAPAENSPLHGSPFHVQTLAEPWHRRDASIPRRAAISAFGFGGINGHVLLEEWAPDLFPPAASDSAQKTRKVQTRADGYQTTNDRRRMTETTDCHPASGIRHPPLDIAIVGMDACFGSFQTLRDFQEAVLSGKPGIRKRPESRWKGCNPIAGLLLDFPELPGGYIEEITLELSDLHIPPNEIPDILLQHLLMLKVSHRAMIDAGYTSRKLRPRMGAVIGMGFDMEATDYHVRWSLGNSHETWLKQAGLSLDDAQKAAWLKSLKDDFGPALNAPRTLGALAGIVASRVAREFGLGAPGFTVSAGSASGFTALDIAARLLQQNEADAMLVGAVDMAGDVRSILIANGISPFSPSGNIRPFDRSADGTLPGEGSAAVVLKRLDRAMAEGNRIYGVIKGVGSACAGSPDGYKSYSQSLRQGLDEAGVSPSSIGLFEAHGSGHPDEDQLEASALNTVFQDDASCVAIGSVKSVIGHTGAAAGMASLIKTCLCLYHEILPPLTGFTQAPDGMWPEAHHHFPGFPQYWTRNRQDGPRRACCAALTANGTCSHVVLEGHETPLSLKIATSADRERRKPLGHTVSGLFIVEGTDRGALISGLNLLDQHIQQQTPFEQAAGSWYRLHPLSIQNPYAVSMIAETPEQLKALIADARQAVSSGTSRRISGRSGIVYTPQPTGISGDIAFVFPGSGNHYVGMGRALAVTWPELLRQMDAETPELKTQMVPAAYVPFRQSWASGWETEAMSAISADSLIPIFGQVVHGSVMTRLIKTFGISPQAVIGYSLGETAGLFALGAWPDRGEMLSRLAESSLFHTELSGPCNSARKAWNIAPSTPFIWKVAAVNRPSDAVKSVLTMFPLARLLIVNSPEECVIGGNQPDVEGVIAALKCEAVYLDGVVTVHCDAALPVRKAYRALHRFPTVQPRNIRFYSCALNRAYALNTESTADSITRQAMSGFDFTKTIHQAYADGVRIFLEMGPHSSCTRMIARILEDRPHLAISASSRGEDEVVSILKLLGTLAAERIFIDLEPLYGEATCPDSPLKGGRQQVLKTGGNPFSPKFPQTPVIPPTSPLDSDGFISARKDQKSDGSGNSAFPKPGTKNIDVPALYPPDIQEAVVRNAGATADAHASFLRFSNALSQDFADGFALQTRLLRHQLTHAFTDDGQQTTASPDPHLHTRAPIPTFSGSPRIAYPRSLCLEFAIGSAASVLGPEFSEVDTYPARVRLPDEPLMLVDRILSVDGKKASLGPGRVVTEHDVVPGAWYLDGGHAPVCISVEAGQADLFLCAYLGIDLQVKGQRTYRLLDAAVQFHRGLPEPGDVIRYEIEIERFVRQGQTWLFFFHFKGFIGSELLITMENGCAGFFTEMEVKNSGGIILTESELQPIPGKIPLDWQELVPRSVETFSDSQVDALRSGNLAACFGTHFSGICLSESLCLPGGRMRLIDRVLALDPNGGRYGLGMIQAQADIHPKDWFLTCHFMDDPVMPGTLMYECCAHALRVFIQRMGWVSETPGVCYEPVVGVQSILKCRGPVTPQTRNVVYQVEIRELGYAPEPYVIADAHMFADGHYIVMFRNLSLKMTGITRRDIETFWQNRLQPASENIQSSQPVRQNGCFDHEQILALCIGKPSDAFGETFRAFDADRFLARLPGPPYLFVDRIVKTEPAPFVLKPGGWIEAEYTVSPSDWYFSADRSGIMPYAVLLEIALQPCGWLAAYAGSALTSPKDLRFRNLGGTGCIHQDVFPETGTLTMRCRMTRVSSASDMIIESFDFRVASGDDMIYDGETTFGFFTESALAQQKGMANADAERYRTEANEGAACRQHSLPDTAPFYPEPDFRQLPPRQMTMPAKAIRMMDVIECYDPAGGPSGLGYIQGSKKVDPDEWFFKAHFYQDPVWPGSLGIEAFIQLLKFIALDRWPHLASQCRFSLITGAEHAWTYRGQVIPGNHKVIVEAIVTRIDELPYPLIIANGFLSVDGLTIYEMKQFGIRLMPLT